MVVIKLDIANRLGRVEAQNLLVKYFVLHGSSPWQRIIPNPRSYWMDQLTARLRKGKGGVFLEKTGFVCSGEREQARGGSGRWAPSQRNALCQHRPDAGGENHP